jgi:hypothetical protein
MHPLRLIQLSHDRGEPRTLIHRWSRTRLDLDEGIR